MAPAALAEVAFAAGQHRRHDDRPADPRLGAGARGDHDAGRLISCPSASGSGVGAHAVVVVAEVGVADAAAGDLDHHLAGPAWRRTRRAAGRGGAVISQRWCGSGPFGVLPTMAWTLIR